MNTPPEPRTTLSYPVDQCMRKLKVPLKFKPYIESHRINELFAGLVKDIILEKPKDVLKFMKRHFERQLEGRDNPKVILLAPPFMNKSELALILMKHLNCTPIQLVNSKFFKLTEKGPMHIEIPSTQIDSVVSLEELLTEVGEEGIENASRIECEVVKYHRDNGLEPPVIDYRSPNLSLDENSNYNYSRSLFSFIKKDTSQILKETLDGLDKEDEVQQVEEESNQKIGEMSSSFVITDPVDLAEVLKKSLDTLGGGWILIDFPRDIKDTLALFCKKIIPTHVISITPRNNHFCSSDSWHLSMEQESFEKYCEITLELKEIYKNFLTEIQECGENLEKLEKRILEAVKIPSFRFITSTPRVVILGTRGSGRQSLGEKLATALNIIHINMVQNSFSKSLSSNDINIDELFTRLLDEECVEKGYVITGFPRNVDELRILDESENNPNRIIFLNIDDNQCIHRLKDRCYNMFTGERLSRSIVENDKILEEIVGTHPRDDLTKVIQDQTAFKKEIPTMLAYCGDRAIVIDTSCDFNNLYIRVLNAIQRPTTINQARSCIPPAEEQNSPLTSPLHQFQSEENCQTRCESEKNKFMIRFPCAGASRNMQEVLNEIRET